MRNKVIKILERMRRGVFERDEALGLSLLSTLAGESIFLLGLPGVGKSMIARRLKLAFEDATVFEYLMSRFSTPDEIFGPVSIAKLKDDDCYERVTAGYLPEAEVVFLDEIWKAGPAIQNALLTVLNERVYLNGNREMQLPLKGVIAASNELPARDEGLEALWDRFLVRYVVNPITEKDNFFKLIGDKGFGSDSLNTTSGKIEEAGKDVGKKEVVLNDDDYAAILEGSREVDLPDIFLEAIYMIRNSLNEKMEEPDPATGDIPEGSMRYYISDRRWKKAVGILRTSAFLNGRKEVDASDILLLSHMLWNEDATIPEIRQMVVETVVSILFRDHLEQFKSSKRHASASKTDSLRLYSPDKRHYIIEAEGSPMKLAIADYEKLMKSPTDVFWGLETADGRIVLRERGQYALRWAKRGYVSINNFVYPLRTESDAQLDNGFLRDLDDSVAMIANGLYQQINSNLFLAGSELPKVVQSVVGMYKQRFQAV